MDVCTSAVLSCCSPCCQLGINTVHCISGALLDEKNKALVQLQNTSNSVCCYVDSREDRLQPSVSLTKI